MYYVYLYLNPLLNDAFIYGDYNFQFEPFYVGKGKNDRCNFHLNESKKNNSKKYPVINKIKKILKSNLEPIIIKIKENLTECDAFILEKELIHIIGRKDLKKGPLKNVTDGGEGASGYIASDSLREIRRINAIKNENHKKIILLKGENHASFGKPVSEERREKQRNSMLGKKMSDDTKEKISMKLIGKKRTLEHCKNISEGLKGKKLSNEHKNKISISKIGKPTWNKNKTQTIYQYDIEFNFLKLWTSLCELESKGYTKSNIINVCKGNRKTHKGFIWTYAEIKNNI